MMGVEVGLVFLDSVASAKNDDDNDVTKRCCVLALGRNVDLADVEDDDDDDDEVNAITV